MAWHSGRRLIQAHPVDRLDGSQMQQVAASKRQRQIILMLSIYHSTCELYDHRTKDIPLTGSAQAVCIHISSFLVQLASPLPSNLCYFCWTCCKLLICLVLQLVLIFANLKERRLLLGIEDMIFPTTLAFGSTAVKASALSTAQSYWHGSWFYLACFSFIYLLTTSRQQIYVAFSDFILTC